MTTNDTFVAEDNMVTSGTVFTHGANAAQALDRALNTLDRFAAASNRVASIETYTATKLYGDAYRIDFA